MNPLAIPIAAAAVLALAILSAYAALRCRDAERAVDDLESALRRNLASSAAMHDALAQVAAVARTLRDIEAGGARATDPQRRTEAKRAGRIAARLEAALRKPERGEVAE